ncbi:13231_t:CDS:1, partial [Dentiscutata heterogama]
SNSSTHDSNIREKVDELYLESMHLENYKHIIIILQQQLQEQENRKLLIIMEFQ